jgi:Tfp pilus assembly protein PilZ
VKSAAQVLQVTFSSAEEFQREHAANLVNGGVFIETAEAAELRETVTVELRLAGCSDIVRLDAEIVHIVPAEMAGAGAKPGVAVQFCSTQTALRAAFEPFIQAAGVPEQAPADPGRRRAPRCPAQVPIRLELADRALVGHTRDISQVGVLISVRGDDLPVGTRLVLTIEHPNSHESMTVNATVTRQVANKNGVMALGIEFDPAPEQREDLRSFVGDLQSTEHTRRLGGIQGSIEELGIQNLIQMLGNMAPSGTITARHGDEEAVVGIEGGMLQYVRLGTVSGPKALSRLMGWVEGTFEFHARLEPVESPDEPQPLDAAVPQATQKLDELVSIDLDALPMDARVRFKSEPAGPGGESTSKLEQSVLDLARSEHTVGRIVDAIPEFDVDVLRALSFLADLGSIAIDSESR